jgi:tetratricopeptide (TPR) repeat protein
MWAGHGISHSQLIVLPDGIGYRNGLNWQQANDYCDSLHVSDFAGWRLPTLDEVKDAVEIIRVNPLPVCPSADIAIHGGCRDQDLAPGTKYSALLLKGEASVIGPSIIWTSTLSQTDSKSAWKVNLSSIADGYLSLVEITKASVSQTDSKSAWEAELKSVPSSSISMAEMTEAFPGVVCVRPMEPSLLQASRAAEVNHPVPDVQTLQTFIPLNKARLAYQAGNYQESITQAQTAISLKADPATAYWGIAISYGRLGQWDQAISNLQSALEIDKNYRDAETALKWAKDGLKAAKKGKQSKEPSPKWN